MTDVPGQCVGVVDVVIVTYNSAGTVRESLAALRGQPLLRHVVVVDNASTDDTRAILAGTSATVVENERNVGFAAGVNEGLRRCRAPYVLLLNPDAVLDGRDLAELLRILAADNAAVAAGPALEGETGEANLGGRRFSTPANRLIAFTPILRRLRYSRHGPEYAQRVISQGQPIVVDYLWGAALLARRAFLVRVGGLDEGFFLYSEDEDLGRKARAQGLRMVAVPKARARHIGGASTPGDEGLAFARLGHAVGVGLAKWSSARHAALFGVGLYVVLLIRCARDLIVRDHAMAAADRRALRVYRQLRQGADPAGRFPA